MTDTKEKLMALVRGGETTEVEFKSARGGLPASLWESYSAFANTNGGTIILGVSEKNGLFTFDGLTNESAQKYRKLFWDGSHNRNKVSVCLPADDDVAIEEIEGSHVLVCHIPRAEYNVRPVYLTTNPLGNTYRRNHEGDYRCDDAEVRRMFADAEHDGHPQDAIVRKGFVVERDIDLPSLHQYRQMLVSLHPAHPWGRITDDRLFMEKIGAYVRNVATGEEGITRAGLLMFGKSDMITNPAGEPFYFVDYRERLYTDDPRVRWTDRVYPDGTWEANLFQFYIRVYNKLIQILPKPFKTEGDARVDETPAHNAVREALVNAIIHQDLNAEGNLSVTLTEECMSFSNPGMMLVSRQQYFKGGRSICRNPTLQKMFMLLGRAEKAGSGVDKIVEGWNFLGWGEPTVAEEVMPDFVVLTLPVVKEKLTKKTYQEKEKLTKKTYQEKDKHTKKSEEVMQQIISFCSTPRSLTEIAEHVGITAKNHLRRKYIGPLLCERKLALTIPDMPTNRNQKYVTIGRK